MGTGTRMHGAFQMSAISSDELNLLPLTYWHEYLDLVFFFKAITGIITVNTGVLPAVRLTTVTRNNNSNVTQFITRKCKTTTFQRSFFNRATRLWNILANDLQLTLSLPLSTFKSILMDTIKTLLSNPMTPLDHGKQFVLHVTLLATCQDG